MMLGELMATARETLTVERVFGEPFDEGGVTLLPAATVSGGGGGGGGHDVEGPDGEVVVLGWASDPSASTSSPTAGFADNRPST